MSFANTAGVHTISARIPYFIFPETIDLSRYVVFYIAIFHEKGGAGNDDETVVELKLKKYSLWSKSCV